MDGLEDVAEKSKRVKRKRRKVAKPQEKIPRPEYDPAYVSLRLLYPGASEIRDNGPVTGQEYSFYPGKITLVDRRDVEGLLARKTNPKPGCCGRKAAEPQPLYGIA